MTRGPGRNMTRGPGIAPRRARARYRLDRRDAQTLATMTAVVGTLHVLGFFTLIVLVVPRHRGGPQSPW